MDTVTIDLPFDYDCVGRARPRGKRRLITVRDRIPAEIATLAGDAVVGLRGSEQVGAIADGRLLRFVGADGREFGNRYGIVNLTQREWPRFLAHSEANYGTGLKGSSPFHAWSFSLDRHRDGRSGRTLMLDPGERPVEVERDDREANLVRAARDAEDMAFVDGVMATARYEICAGMRINGTWVETMRDTRRLFRPYDYSGVVAAVPASIAVEFAEEMGWPAPPAELFGLPLAEAAALERRPNAFHETLARSVRTCLSCVVPHGGNGGIMGDSDYGVPNVPEDLDESCMTGRRLLRELTGAYEGDGVTEDTTERTSRWVERFEELATAAAMRSPGQGDFYIGHVAASAAVIRTWARRERATIPSPMPDAADVEAIEAMGLA